MDARDAEGQFGKWYESFDQERMVFIMIHETVDEEGYDVEAELELPAKWEVCELCDGRGKHVNPSIDGHGISAHEFAEDPDFAEDYYSGMFDVQCYRCKGRTTEPVVDEEACSEETLKIYQEAMRDRAFMIRERAMEMRYGY